MAMVDVSQEQALEILNSGINLFISGAGGTGKTHLIKEFAKKSSKNVALTATTGIAALNLGGETVHRFLGTGITTRPEQAELITKKLCKFKNSNKPWEKAKWQVLSNLDVLVIDEVSMLRRDHFELIEVVLSIVKNNPKPFGGVQVVLVGDFFQLPPVVTQTQERQYADLKNPYCFQSIIWSYGKFNSINLTTNYRQSNEEFLDLLNNIRVGNITDDINETMKSRLNKKLDTDIQPIKLFSHKVDVATENKKCLISIKEPKYMSKAEYTGKQMDIEILTKDTPAEDKLYFCKGAQIMMLTNEPKDLWVNGSLGIVMDVEPVLIKLANGSVIAPELHKWERVVYKVVAEKWTKSVVSTMKQYPFRLSWATTTHKSQSLTFDYVEIDIKKSFAAGQVYTSLSRVRTIEGLSLKSWDKKAVITSEVVKKFYSLI